MVVVEKVGPTRYQVTDMETGKVGEFTATPEQFAALQADIEQAERDKRGAA
jgi:hypothetical protein